MRRPIAFTTALLFVATALTQCGKSAPVNTPPATNETAGQTPENVPANTGTPAQTPQPAQPAQEKTFAGIEFIWVNPGTFEMGAAMSPEQVYKTYEGDLRWYANEQPRHKVTLTKGFWLGKYEVTQAQWRAIMGDTQTKKKGDSLPIDGISWDDCQAFIKKINEKAEGTFRLPTEAEWEYACRAGTNTEFCFGDDKTLLNDYGWHFGNSLFQSHEVGKKKPNPWGFYDMHGNVWEWCQDWFDKAYYTKSPDTDPKGPDTGVLRVLRGGSSKRTETKCRSAFRYQNKPEFKTPNQGFRLARDPD